MRKTGKIMGILLVAALALTGCSKEPAEKVDTTPVPTETPVLTETPAELDDVVLDGMTKDILKGMTLREKIGQLFIVNLEQLDKSKGSFYEHQAFTEEMKDALRTYKPGGVIFFSRNMTDREQTKKFISDLQGNTKIPMFISVDEEGGNVARIANNTNMRTTAFPTPEEIGATEDEDYVYNMGTTIGSEIKELGFNLNFAPVADVRTNSFNTEIGDRSFGSDPKLVAAFVKQMVKGLQEQNISAALKHFPGHGDASEDSHQGPVNVENDLNRLRSVEFLPFSAGIKEGVDFVMVTHLSISRVTGTIEPACMSNLIVEQILRQEMKFDGIAITDAMDMGAITEVYEPGEAAVKAVKAGMDVILMPTDLEEAYNAVLEAVKSGEITEKSINESVSRVIRTKLKREIIPMDTDLIKD